MALLSEVIVEEWLNRDGGFTTRGIKIGVDVIDILALNPTKDGVQCGHVEARASFIPLGHLTKVPKARRRQGQGAGSAKHRSDEALRADVLEWVLQKFDHPKTLKQRKQLLDGNWSREPVGRNVKYPEELDLIRKAGIKIRNLSEPIADFRRDDTVVSKAPRADFVDLVTGFDLRN